MTAHPDDARADWRPGWADRLPIGTPPTVPRERPGRDLVRDFGRWAVERAAAGAEDGVAAFREAVVARKDPVRKHAKRVRRERRKLGVESAVAGGFALLAATTGIAPGPDVVEVGFGAVAAVVGVAALGAARRLGQLHRNPPPPPRPRDLPRPKRPPRDCPARRPLDRLAERERALAGLLGHLGAAGDEPREVAVDAAATLRELGARVTAVDRARRGALPASAAGLDAAVAVLVGQLETGVAAYDALVVAAADAVAASATLQAGDAVLLLRLTEATDSLAGLAQGLHEIAG